MAIDPGTIVVQGVAGYATQKTVEALHDAGNTGPSPQEQMISLLTEIRDALAPKEKTNFNRSLALQPYPYEYIVDEEWHGKSHFCIFFHDSTPIRFDVEGVGTYNKTVGPGWVQCDVRGRISTTDSQNHNVIISYREDALGSGL